MKGKPPHPARVSSSRLPETASMRRILSRRVQAGRGGLRECLPVIVERNAWTLPQESTLPHAAAGSSATLGDRSIQ